MISIIFIILVVFILFSIYFIICGLTDLDGEIIAVFIVILIFVGAGCQFDLTFLDDHVYGKEPKFESIAKFSESEGIVNTDKKIFEGKNGETYTIDNLGELPVSETKGNFQYKKYIYTKKDHSWELLALFKPRTKVVYEGTLYLPKDQYQDYRNKLK